MKVNKSQGTLYIFDTLKLFGFINKKDIMDALEINELTFWRYIQELRAYIYNFNKEYDLVYSRTEDRYYLINK